MFSKLGDRGHHNDVLDDKYLWIAKYTGTVVSCCTTIIMRLFCDRYHKSRYRAGARESAACMVLR